MMKNNSKKTVRVELEKINLSYYDIGVNKKIYELINKNVKCYITYKEVECDVKYEDHNKSRNAYYAGYSKTYLKKVPISWEYNINSLIKFFKTHNKVTFRRKEVEFENLKYIELLKDFR